MPVEIWERQENESSVAYQAFATFRDIGPGRTIELAYTISYRRKTGVLPADESNGKTKRAPGQWAVWASKNSWSPRAKAWDDRLERERLTAISEVRKKQAVDWASRRHEQREGDWTSAAVIRGRAYKILNDKQGQDGRAWERAAKMLKIASDLGRIAAEMPVKIEQVEVPAESVDRKGLFTSPAELADQMPIGAIPEMPTDANRRPHIDTLQVAKEDGVLTQPAKPPRPGTT